MNSYFNKKKVLVLSRGFKHKGGVVNFVKTLIKSLDSSQFSIEHFEIGRRYYSRLFTDYIFFLLSDIIRLFMKLYNGRYDLIHLNPSLGKIPILRDCFFLLIAKLLSIRVLVFWHGWDVKTEKFIDNHKILKNLFRYIFDSADAASVLAFSFKNKLRSWGFCQKIYVETTSFDDSLVEGYSLKRKIDEIRNSNSLRLLFLSRIEKSKGIFQTIDAFLLLIKKGHNVELLIAGDGTEFHNIKNYIEEINDKRIKLLGYVTGDRKRAILEDSHIFCLPSYSEGLPVSIIEAMAFGIAIITREVGGIRDIFTDSLNGFYIDSDDNYSIVKKMERLLIDRVVLEQMAVNNYCYAKKYFSASMVSKRIHCIYENTTVK